MIIAISHGSNQVTHLTVEAPIAVKVDGLQVFSQAECGHPDPPIIHDGRRCCRWCGIMLDGQFV